MFYSNSLFFIFCHIPSVLSNVASLLVTCPLDLQSFRPTTTQSTSNSSPASAFLRAPSSALTCFDAARFGSLWPVCRFSRYWTSNFLWDVCLYAAEMQIQRSSWYQLCTETGSAVKLLVRRGTEVKVRLFPEGHSSDYGVSRLDRLVQFYVLKLTFWYVFHMSFKAEMIIFA